MKNSTNRILAISMVAIMLAMLVPMTAEPADATTPAGGFIASKWTYGTNYASNGEDTGLTFSGPTRTSDFRTAYGLLNWGTGAYEMRFKVRMTEAAGDGARLIISLRPDVLTTNPGGELTSGVSMLLDFYRMDGKALIAYNGECGGGFGHDVTMTLNQDYWFYVSRYYEGGMWKMTLKYWTGSASYENPTWQTTGSISGSNINAKYLQIGTLNTGSSATSYRFAGSITDSDPPWPPVEFTGKPSVANIIKTVDGRTVTASTVAENYTSIVWDMGDNTTYTGVTQVRHDYADNGTYTVTVTAYDWLGQEASTSTAVQIGENETASVSIDLPWIIFAIAAVVTGLLFLLTRDPRALIGVVLAGAAMIVMVML